MQTFTEILKFNPYHDERGRFATANGFTSFTYAPGKSKAHDLAIQREKERQAAQKPKFTFTPAKTTKEAEEYAKQFCQDCFGATGISYAGISVESANEINKTIGEIYATYDIEKIGGVTVCKGNTKLGKAIENAQMAYSPIRNSLLINNRSCKNPSDVEKSQKEAQDLIDIAKAKGIDALTYKTARAKAVVENSMESGRSTVAKNLSEAVTHEIGHHFEKSIKASGQLETVEAGMSTYAKKVSGYATTSISEYIAESFTSYRRGENVIDPALKSIFEGMKK